MVIYDRCSRESRRTVSGWERQGIAAIGPRSAHTVFETKSHQAAERRGLSQVVTEASKSIAAIEVAHGPEPSNRAEHHGAPTQLIVDNPFEDSEPILAREIIVDLSVNQMRACYDGRPNEGRKKVVMELLSKVVFRRLIQAAA